MGKSCILLKYTQERFKDKYDVTIGVEYATKAIMCRDASVRLQIWDTVSPPQFPRLGRLRSLQVDNADILQGSGRRARGLRPNPRAILR